MHDIMDVTNSKLTEVTIEGRFDNYLHRWKCPFCGCNNSVDKPYRLYAMTCINCKAALTYSVLDKNWYAVKGG
jgi:transcription elongation factor Elf1